MNVEVSSYAIDENVETPLYPYQHGSILVRSFESSVR